MADTITAESILRTMARDNPADYEGYACAFCLVEKIDENEHDGDCPWVAARRFFGLSTDGDFG